MVFVGYRFPQTDANAKRRLLAALGRLREHYVPIHIGMGPDKNQPDVVRLEAMIRYALRDRFEHPKGSDPPKAYEKWYNLIVQPLWAVDGEGFPG